MDMLHEDHQSTDFRKHVAKFALPAASM